MGKCNWKIFRRAGGYTYLLEDRKPRNGEYCLDGDMIFGPYEEGDQPVTKFYPILETDNPELIKAGVKMFNTGLYEEKTLPDSLLTITRLNDLITE